MTAYTEDHLVEQPAIQLIQHELGWDVVNCYDEWVGGVSNQGRDGKREGVGILNVQFWILNGRGRRPTLRRLNPDLPVEAIEGAVEEMEILNDESVVAFGFAGTSSWILNGRGRRQTVPRQNPALSLAEETVVHGNIGVYGVREHLNFCEQNACRAFMKI